MTKLMEKIESLTRSRVLALGRCGPIGIDLGNRSVKMLQFDTEGSRLHEYSRWELEPVQTDSPEEHDRRSVEALKQAREGRNFRGRKAILCLGGEEIFVQGVRVSRANKDVEKKEVMEEIAGKLPYPKGTAEIRILEGAEIRQGDEIKREMLAIAASQDIINRKLWIAEQAGFETIRLDLQPMAVLRCYRRQFRRDEDKQACHMFVHIGSSNTSVILAREELLLFVKYVPIGGRHLDEAIARHLEMELPEASALRRQIGDRRTDQQDPEIVRSLMEATRGIFERWGSEISMCARYYSVTFRGHPIHKIIVGGGEATNFIVDYLGSSLGLKCELGDPLRYFENARISGRKTQWDVAAGLALARAVR